MWKNLEVRLSEEVQDNVPREKKNRDRGLYCNWIQLCNQLGGYLCAAARAEAKIYADEMQRRGFPYYVKHGVTKAENWMFVSKLLETKVVEH